MSTAAKLRQARAAQRRLDNAETASRKAGTMRDQAVREAADQGATRAQLQEATGLSQARITQVLRRARLTQ